MAQSIVSVPLHRVVTSAPDCSCLDIDAKAKRDPAPRSSSRCLQLPVGRAHAMQGNSRTPARSSQPLLHPSIQESTFFPRLGSIDRSPAYLPSVQSHRGRQSIRAQSAEQAAVPQPAPPAKSFHWTDITRNASQYMPQAIVISTALGLFYPPSFTWFTNKYYPSALGFLMFAVGINLSLDDFKHAFQRPAVLALGYFGQFVLKPLFGYALAHSLVPLLGLPDAIGSGLILVACVSGAQLSNYASFLVDKQMAPLSIVMTALSTASAALITPTLTHAMLGQRLPVDVKGMMISILQCVVAPVAAGLALNRFARSVTSAIRPVLPLLSLLDTCCCIGSPLALNAGALRSPFGLVILLPVLAFHTVAFIGGYYSAVGAFPRIEDRRNVARTMSFEVGMQSSLLALALANRFFPNPLVALPCAISVIAMSLMGFGLVVVWTHPRKHTNSH